MRTFTVVASIIALLPIPAAAGGKACQIRDSAIPTPGLGELATGSTTNPMPEKALLSKEQIDTLAEADTNFRKALREINEQVAKLPAGPKRAASGVSSKPLAELVTAFLARAARDQALLIEVESAGEFWFANDEALAAQKKGEKDRFCALCIAVRQGVEAAFRWDESEFGELTEAQKKELAALGQKRDDLKRKWAAVLKEELTAPQLEHLRDAQMRWLKKTLKSAVAGGMKSLGDERCEACSGKEGIDKKCEFCWIVTSGVDEAKRQLRQ
ncbi:MAG: hypothetical protein AAB074_11995 [Planctomycetota bacterium]